MFYVRCARALPSTTTVGPSLHVAHAAATPRHPVSWPRTPPSSYAFLSTRQNANKLSDANKLLIRCAWSGSAEFVNRYGSAWSSLGACSPLPPPPPYPPGSAPAPPPPSFPPPLPCVDTDNGATNMYSAPCVSMPPHMCGGMSWSYDDDDFTASVMCCVCGGGYTASPPSAPPPPAPPPYPPGAAPQPPPPYAFTDTASLKTAAQEYNTDVDSATATYGPISSWGVSAVTSMNNLFSYLNQFNADISSWDTSGVTDMSGMFWVRSARALPAACTVGGPPSTLLVPPRPPHALLPPGPHVAPLPMHPFRLGRAPHRSISR